MSEESPWYQLYNYAAPNFSFCGEMAVGWNVDPFDTYSSILYLILSFILYRKTLNSSELIRTFYIIPIILFWGSILFHMSFTFVFLIADFLGIFFLSFYCIALNLIRLKIIKKSYIKLKCSILMIIWAGIMWISYKSKVHSGINMIPLVFTFFVSEYFCYKKNKYEISYVNFYYAIICLGIGYIFMLSEGKPFYLGCTRGTLLNKLELHSIWHLFSVISIYNIFIFYKQKSIANELD